MARNRHRARADGTHCPDPDHCNHTTDVPGEPCECCGRVVSSIIGSVTDAATLLDTDAAGVFELIARGRLRAERPDDSGPWLISFADGSAR